MLCAVTRPALLRQLPKLRWATTAPALPVPGDARGEFGALAADFAILDQELVPTFSRLDAEALRAQNTFRLQQLILIGGSAVATICGTVQAATHGSASWLGWIEAVLAGTLAGMAAWVRRGEAHQRYLTSRLKAERLRSEFFVFL